MFTLTAEPIAGEALKERLSRQDAGAVVIFEGRVRNQNLGRAVHKLEYEGAPEIAANEFAKIENEAHSRFAIIELVCAHRTGTLQVNDVSVWIGVIAPHRDAAFRACRYAIDELKKRLPIWKKEHYADGDSGWINAP